MAFVFVFFHSFSSCILELNFCVFGTVSCSSASTTFQISVFCLLNADLVMSSLTV